MLSRLNTEEKNILSSSSSAILIHMNIHVHEKNTAWIATHSTACVTTHAVLQGWDVQHIPSLQHSVCDQGLKNLFFCVLTDELLRVKDDLLSEGGQS